MDTLNFVPQVVKGIAFSLSSEGDIFSVQGEMVASELDAHGLHDSVLLGVVIEAETRLSNSMTLAGILPDLVHFYLLHFELVECLTLKGIVIGRQMGVEHLSVSRGANNLLQISVVGEFEGQTLGFTCQKASYRKFKLDSPISRLMLGW